GVDDLAVDGQVDEVFELLCAEAAADEAELQGRLLAALGEVRLVEREAELSVFEDEVLAGVVVFASRGFHGRFAAGRCDKRALVGIIRPVPALAIAVHGMLHAPSPETGSEGRPSGGRPGPPSVRCRRWLG